MPAGSLPTQAPGGRFTCNGIALPGRRETSRLIASRTGVQQRIQHALVFGVTRAHCVAFAERAPVSAGSWGDGPPAPMGRARRARPPSIARAWTGLSSALPLPASCQHPTLEGGVTDPLLTPASSRSTCVVAGDGVAADVAGVTLLDRSVFRDTRQGFPRADVACGCVGPVAELCGRARWAVQGERGWLGFVGVVAAERDPALAELAATAAAFDAIQHRRTLLPGAPPGTPCRI